MRHKGRLLSVLATLLICCVCFSPEALAKVKREKVVMLQGSTRIVPMDSTDVKNLKIKKNNIKVTAKDFAVTIKAKKVGKSVITYSIPGLKDKYRIDVKVLSLKKVKKASTAKLKKAQKKLAKGAKYAYYDLNRDGIKELLTPGKITYYDYAKKKCVSKKYNFSDIYVSKSSDMFLMIYEKPKKTEEFTYLCEYYKPRTAMIFDLADTGTGYRQYTDAGLSVYGAALPYSYYDFGYDQDDYEYEDMSEEEVSADMRQKVPGYKKIVWKVKKK